MVGSRRRLESGHTIHATGLIPFLPCSISANREPQATGSSMSQVQSLLYSLCGGCCGCTSCELLISGLALTPLELPNLPVVVLIALDAPPFFPACIPLRPDMIAPLGVAVPARSAELGDQERLGCGGEPAGAREASQGAAHATCQTKARITQTRFAGHPFHVPPLLKPNSYEGIVPQAAWLASSVASIS